MDSITFPSKQPVWAGDAVLMALVAFLHMAIIATALFALPEQRLRQPHPLALSLPVSITLVTGGALMSSHRDVNPRQLRRDMTLNESVSKQQARNTTEADAATAADKAGPRQRIATPETVDSTAAASLETSRVDGRTDRGGSVQTHDVDVQFAPAGHVGVATNAAATKPVAVSAVSVPRLDADYLSNPAPEYPAVSRRLGEQGTVILDVLVSAEGFVVQARTHRSSGYVRLDGAALKAIAAWRFVPAQGAGINEQAKVLVPIVFNLRQG